MTASDHRASLTTLAIREIREDDAAELLRLQHLLDEETTMMMLEPGERRSDVDETRSHLRETLASPNSTIIVAESDALIVGYVEAEGGRYRRTRHSAYVIIGVLQSCQGRGIGGALLAALRSWAPEHGVSRLELTVRTDNAPARRLYERVGFEVEGLRRASLRVGEEMINEYSMALAIDLQHSGAAAAGELGVRALRPDEGKWLEQQLIRLWGSTQVVSRNRVHDASTLRAIVCQTPAEERVGLALIDIRDRQCELVTIDAFQPGQGIGSALLAAATEQARREGCSRLWLITTNDNLRALRFYQRRGLRLVALHRGAIDEARRVRPSIPIIGEHRIPIRDELELELLLDRPDV
jgi:ribosomal protein S18 acetylase RimI-like enzyme